MKVISHDDVSQQIPAKTDDGLLESGDQPASVRVIANDLLAGIPPRHHVIDGAFELDSQSSWHFTRLGVSNRCQARNQKQRLTPDSPRGTKLIRHRAARYILENEYVSSVPESETNVAVVDPVSDKRLVGPRLTLVDGVETIERYGQAWPGTTCAMGDAVNVKGGIIERAQALHVQGRFIEAERAYREALAARPGDLRSLEGLGVLAFQQGARRRSGGGTSRAAFGFGQTRLVFAAIWVRRFDYSVGASKLESIWMRRSMWIVLSRRPGTVWDCWRTTSGGLLIPNPHAGRRSVLILGSRRPTSISGMRLQALRRPLEAVSALRTALAIEPDNFLGLTNLGQVLSETGDPDVLGEAESICRRAEALAPAHPQPAENLGNILRLQGRNQEALECYKRSLRDRRRAMPCHYIGHLLEERERYDEAERFYQIARDLEPGNARFQADLGSLATAREHFDQAADHFGKAILLDPKCVEGSHPRAGARAS